MSATVSLDRGVGRTLLGACSPCCSFTPPPPEPTVSVECRSWTSSEATQVCGWSGYRPDGNTQANSDPTAPWQGRKWRVRSAGGGYAYSCFISGGVYAGQSTWVHIYEGEASFTGCALDTLMEFFFAEGPTSPTSCTSTYTKSDLLGTSDKIEPFDNTGLGSAVLDINQTLTSKTWVAGDDEEIFPDFFRVSIVVGNLSETLTNEVDAAEEIFNSSGVEGTSCCASTSSSSVTVRPPESTLPLTYASGSVAVELTISGTGVPETEYTVTLYFEDEDSNETSRQFDVTTDDGSTRDPLDGLGEFEFTFNIPQPNRPNGELCYTRAEIEPNVTP